MDASNAAPSSPNEPAGLVTGAQHTMERLAEVAGQAAETIADKKARLARGRQEMMDSCRDYVAENPGAALGIAVAAGFLLRHLIRPR